MLDVLFVALLQAAAGEPAPAPAVAPTEAAQAAPEAAPAEATPEAERPRCRTGNVFGSRVRRERVCSTRETSREFQKTLQGVQNNGMGQVQPAYALGGP